MATNGKTVNIKFSELAGDALSYAVALATGTVEKHYRKAADGALTAVGKYEPWATWAQGGPLFDKYHPTITGTRKADDSRDFYAIFPTTPNLAAAHGSTHLIAVCRAAVLAEVGPVVAIPDTFLNSQVQALAKDKNDEQGHLPLDSGPQDIAKAPTASQKAAHAANKPAQVDKPAQEAKPAQGKPTAAPKAQATPKPTGKPLPQGKQAQAAKAHGEAQEKAPAKGKGK